MITFFVVSLANHPPIDTPKNDNPYGELLPL